MGSSRAKATAGETSNSKMYSTLVSKLMILYSPWMTLQPKSPWEKKVSHIPAGQ